MAAVAVSSSALGPKTKHLISCATPGVEGPSCCEEGGEDEVLAHDEGPKTSGGGGCFCFCAGRVVVSDSSSLCLSLAADGRLGPKNRRL